MSSHQNVVVIDATPGWIEPQGWSNETVEATPVRGWVRTIIDKSKTKEPFVVHERYRGDQLVRPFIDYECYYCDHQSQERVIEMRDEVVEAFAECLRKHADLKNPDIAVADNTRLKRGYNKKSKSYFGEKIQKISFHLVLAGGYCMSLSDVRLIAQQVESLVGVEQVDFEPYLNRNRHTARLLRLPYTIKKQIIEEPNPCDPKPMLPVTDHNLAEFFITNVDKDCYLECDADLRETDDTAVTCMRSCGEGERLSEDNVQDLMEVVEMIKLKESGDRGKWLSVAGGITGSCESRDVVKDIFNGWSRSQPKFVDVEECEKVIDSFSYGTGIGVLINHAKHDSPEEYKAFRLKQKSVEEYKEVADFVTYKINEKEDRLHPPLLPKKDRSKDTSYLECIIDRAIEQFPVGEKAVALVGHHLFGDTHVCVDKNILYYFDGVRWHEDTAAIKTRNKFSGSDVAPLFSNYSKRLYKMAKNKNLDDDDKKAIEKRAKTAVSISSKLGQARYLANIIVMYQDLCFKEKFVDKLDENRDLLGCDNGVLDFKAGIFRDSVPEDYISKTTRLTYSKKSNPVLRAKINEFFESVFDHDQALILYVKLVLGYSLAGHVRMHKIYMWVGSGRNGKSSLVTLLKTMFGEYMLCPNIALWMNSIKDGNAPSPVTAELKSIRFVAPSEPDENDKWNMGNLKAASGGDTMSARKLHKAPIEFSPQYTIMAAMNGIPDMNGTSGPDMAKRLEITPFKMCYTDKVVTDRDRPVDTGLLSSFEEKDMGAEFLLMLFELYNDNKMNDPKYRISPPTSVTRFTASYLDDFSNLAAVWLNARTVSSKDGVIDKSDAFADFTDWHQIYMDNTVGGTSDITITNRKFNLLMAKAGYPKLKQNNGNTSTYGFEGIVLKDDQTDAPTTGSSCPILTGCSGVVGSSYMIGSNDKFPILTGSQEKVRIGLPILTGLKQSVL
jgi:P4 family phage/plasmid primase-like protien